MLDAGIPTKLACNKKYTMHNMRMTAACLTLPHAGSTISYQLGELNRICISFDISGCMHWLISLRSQEGNLRFYEQLFICFWCFDCKWTYADVCFVLSVPSMEIKGHQFALHLLLHGDETGECIARVMHPPHQMNAAIHVQIAASEIIFDGKITGLLFCL